MAEIELTEVSKTYPDGTIAVTDLDLRIGDGELVVLVGPSGCGKTTALRMVAGLEEITSGTIRIGGVVVNELHPGVRDIAMVFQNYALYPHMTVRENIGFPLKLARVPRRAREKRVVEVARLLGLEQHLRRRPRQLSGGQRQRVAMGRALIRKPRVFLMDEPLSNLDAKLRVQMRAEISNGAGVPPLVAKPAVTELIHETGCEPVDARTVAGDGRPHQQKRASRKAFTVRELRASPVA